MKYNYLILATILTLIFTFIFTNPCISSKDFNGYLQKRVKMGSGSYCLYLANTEIEKQSGLSNKEIKSSEGMIFTFDKSGFYRFWMKDMNYSLDFVYLDNDLVVDIKENISPSTYPNTFTSIAPANKIIELKTGEIKKSNVKKGDKIIF